MKISNKIYLNFTYAVFATMSLLLQTSCGPKSEEIVQNYSSGEISRRHTEVNGKKEGKMTEYYKDGKIKGERLFENDIQVGKSVFYYPSGKIEEVQYYVDGKMHGGDTVFYENGQPQFLRTYNKGVLDGYIRKWSIDDSLIYEARYANDVLVEVKGEPIQAEMHPKTTMDSMQQK